MVASLSVLACGMRKKIISSGARGVPACGFNSLQPDFFERSLRRRLWEHKYPRRRQVERLSQGRPPLSQIVGDDAAIKPASARMIAQTAIPAGSSVSATG